MGALMRVSLATGMQYRSDFLLEAATGIIRTVATVLTLLVVYGHREQVAGWTLPEAMLVMGLFLIMNALTLALLEPNLGAVVDEIRKGTLDLVLMKPADSQLLVSAQRLAPGRLWDGVGALFVVGWSLNRMHATPSALDVALAFALFASGLVAIYGLWLLAICTSFYFVRVDNLRFLLMSATDAGRWPLSVFSGWIRALLTVVVPVALVTTFPAEALRGTWTASTVVVAAVVAVAFVLGSRVAWLRALASYTSASS